MRPETPLAVIVRRGPAHTAATFGWDRRTDQIQLGQWLRARLFERRSDLSDDGRYLIYFARNGHWQGEALGAWTAISFAPYLKALTLWPKGDCWQGGGLFTRQGTFWLNGCHAAPLVKGKPPRQGKRKAPLLEQTEAFPGVAHYNAECLGVYFNRLQRDGWQLGEISSKLAVFDKPFDQNWTLRKYAFTEIHRDPGRGVYYDEHELRHQRSGETVALPDWEWAEVDGRRLVWASGGRLWVGWPGERLFEEAILLKDFNDMPFTAVAAPY